MIPVLPSVRPGSRFRAAFASLLVLIFFLPARAPAEVRIPESPLVPGLGIPSLDFGLPVVFNADRLSFDEESGVAVAEGNVEVGWGSRTMTADRIRYDARTGEAELSGHVHFRDEGDEFSFERIVINLRSGTGTLYDGSIRMSTNNYQIASQTFEKTGPRTFVVRKGTLTTCPTDPEPDWSFRVGKATVTIDEYAVGRDVTFRIRGVPVFWLPYGVFPVKVRRQSGFLLPTVSNSNVKGFTVELPFYWAVNRWSDATISVEAMTKRGIRPEAEYRFVLTPRSEGEARFSWLRDDILKKQRYRADGSVDLRYGEDWKLAASWDVPSDDRYYADLEDDENLRTARHVISRGFLGVKGPSANHALGAAWTTDLQGTPDDNTVQRLPEYTGTVLPLSLGGSGIDFGMELQATWFHRDTGTREGRGRGTATATRPFTAFSSVTLAPYAGLEFLYSATTSGAGGEEGAGRALPVLGADLSAKWSREFERPGNPRFVHTVTPSAGFRYIPARDQSEIPLTDQWSRVGDQRQFLFSLVQRLVRMDPNGPSEAALLEVHWAYDLSDRAAPETPYIDPLLPYVRTLSDQIELANGRSTRRDDHSSDIYARLLTTSLGGWILGGELLVNPSGDGITSAAVAGGFSRGKEREALLEYRNSKGLAEDLNGRFGFRPFRFLGLLGKANYSLRDRDLTEGSATAILYPRSECWNVGITVERNTRPDDTSVKLSFELRGIGSYGN